MMMSMSLRLRREKRKRRKRPEAIPSGQDAPQMNHQQAMNKTTKPKSKDKFMRRCKLDMLGTTLPRKEYS